MIAKKTSGFPYVSVFGKLQIDKKVIFSVIIHFNQVWI